MPAPEPYLQVDVEPGDDGVVVRVGGEIDAATAPQLGAALEQAADGTGSIALDFGAVTFIDSSGLRVVARAHAAAAGAGRDFAVSVASDPVRKIFAMTGLDALLASG